MNKSTDIMPQIANIGSEAELKELHWQICKEHTNIEALLEREKWNTKRIFDCLYDKEDTFWEHYALQINPDYIIYDNKACLPKKKVKRGINVIYPNVMSTSRLEIHTTFLGKYGNFLCSIFEIYGYTTFTFNQIMSTLRKDYPHISQEQIIKTLKQCFRYFLFEQILILS